MELEERIAKCEANDENIFHQLTEIKSDMKDIHTLASSVEVIASRMEGMSQTVSNIDNRIKEIESRPVKDYQHYKQLIVDCVLTGVIGALVGAILVMILK